MKLFQKEDFSEFRRSILKSPRYYHGIYYLNNNQRCYISGIICPETTDENLFPKLPITVKKFEKNKNNLGSWKNVKLQERPNYKKLQQSQKRWEKYNYWSTFILLSIVLGLAVLIIGALAYVKSSH